MATENKAITVPMDINYQPSWLSWVGSTTTCLNALGKEGIFDIASEETMSLTDIFSEAARLGGTTPSPTRLPEKLTLGAVSLLWKLGLCPIPSLYLKMYGYDITRDVSKTIGALGKPRFTLQQILKEIVEG